MLILCCNLFKKYMVIFNTQKFLSLKVDSQHLFRKHRKHIQVCRKFEQRYTVMQAKDTRLQNNHMNTKNLSIKFCFYKRIFIFHLLDASTEGTINWDLISSIIKFVYELPHKLNTLDIERRLSTGKTYKYLKNLKIG